MKLSILGAILLVTPFVLINPLHSAESEVELYRFCSKFRFNSRCKGYEMPLSLEKRVGARGECSLKSNNLNLTESTSCKGRISDGNLVMYLEKGKSLDFLDEQKATRELLIPLNKVITLDYSEYSRNNHNAFGNNGIIGLVIGSIAARQENLSEIEIGFTTPLAPEVDHLEFLTFVTEKDLGLELQKQLKQLTSNGLTIPYNQEKASYLEALGTGNENSEQLDQLLKTNKCKQCDLRGADFESANLAEAELTLINLDGANLQSANLDSVKLRGASLRAANLKGAILSNADLTSKNKHRTNLRLADLQNANLTHAKLRGANFGQANLESANLENSNLSNGVVHRGEWQYIFPTDLSKANLQNAKFSGSKLKGALFLDADLSNADLSSANLRLTKLDRANLTNANLSHSDLDKASLVNANLTSADLSNAKLELANLANANLNRALLVNVDLRGANLNSAILSDIDLSGANLTDADLTNTDLESSNLCGTTMPNGLVSRQGCK